MSLHGSSVFPLSICKGLYTPELHKVIIFCISLPHLSAGCQLLSRDRKYWTWWCHIVHSFFQMLPGVIFLLDPQYRGVIKATGCMSMICRGVIGGIVSWLSNFLGCSLTSAMNSPGGLRVAAPFQPQLQMRVKNNAYWMQLLLGLHLGNGCEVLRK